MAVYRQSRQKQSDDQPTYRPTKNPPKAEFKDQMIDYLQSGMTQRGNNPVAPDWIPSRIKLPRDVRGDVPVGHMVVASAGEHECQCNVWGAISVTADDGQPLGIKPGEYEILEFCWNEKKQIMAREKQA
jgi:hypothetical protein